jgi:DNA helicase-2/ATP-dependent DNA helicase PcrA
MRLADKVRAQVADPEIVTPQQRAAVEHPGNLMLLACPGSGKTRIVAFRTAFWATAEEPRVVAATTYTNVAVAEISQATEFTDVPFASPHFLGTLHGLLLRYVVYPFVHLVDDAPRNVRVVHRGHWAAPPKVAFKGEKGAIDLEDYVFRADGNLALESVPVTFARSREQALEEGQVRALREKTRLLKRGLISSSDAMYVAMQILEQRRDLCEAVAGRFDELVIDEVQDCSDVQLRCLRLLFETHRLRSLVLIGDPDQAIYGWLGATPEAVISFAREASLKELPLTRNFRSSQSICNRTCQVVGRPTPDVASGPHRDFNVTPEVIAYGNRDPTAAVAAFDTRLDQLGISRGNSVVLARGWTLVDRINQRAGLSVAPGVGVLAKAAGQRASLKRITVDAVRSVDRLVASILYEDRPARLDVAELRPLTMEILDTLPAFEDDLASWAQKACAVVRDVLAPRSFAKQPGDLIRKRAGNDAVAVADFVAELSVPPRARVVHSAKGESHDAVLLVAPAPRADRNPAVEWVKALDGELPDEESRVGYVALTRARKYCAIAIPLPQCDAERDVLLNAGWQMSRDSA